MILLRKFFLVVFGFIFFFSAITATPAEAAVQYILSITSDITNLNRGDVVTFAIDIRTKGETVTSPVVGLSFDPSKIQFVSASPGDPAFSSISAQDLGGGKILFNGASPSGFTGDTTFANSDHRHWFWRRLRRTDFSHQRSFGVRVHAAPPIR